MSESSKQPSKTNEVFSLLFCTCGIYASHMTIMYIHEKLSSHSAIQTVGPTLSFFILAQACFSTFIGYLLKSVPKPKESEKVSQVLNFRLMFLGMSLIHSFVTSLHLLSFFFITHNLISSSFSLT